MTKTIFLLLPLVVLLIIVTVLIYFKETYTISNYIYPQPKTKLEIERNNVTKYIVEKLDSISNLTKKAHEREYFNKYLMERQKIIKLLPRLSRQNVFTTFHILFEKTRKHINNKYELVILISSHSLHFGRRKDIRRIWGNVNSSISKNWTLFFMTGGVNNKVGMIRLYNEAIKERDIVIVDFMESYSLNMGKKVMSGLQWLHANFRYDFVLKCDDDIFVDIDALLTTLRKVKSELVYMGNVRIGSEVLRSGKWAVPIDEYPASVYKPYISGGGFVLSYNLVKEMIPIFQWEHPLRIDDAYFGDRVLKAGGEATDNQGFLMSNGKCEYINNLLVTHPANRRCLEKLQKIIFGRRKNYTLVTA